MYIMNFTSLIFIKVFLCAQCRVQPLKTRVFMLNRD